MGLALITAGTIVLLFVAYQLFGTNLTEHRHQAELKRSFNQPAHTQPSAGNTGGAGGSESPTVGGAASPTVGAPLGQALDHLVIPKIGVDQYVVQGVSEDDLTHGPGHYPQTALPGEAGNAAIAGHRTTYGAPFFRLNELSMGDYIDVTNRAGQTFRYQVSHPALTVSPSDVSVLDPTPDAELTLTTCTPRFTASSRLVIRATLVGTPPLPVTHIATANLGPGAVIDNLGAGNKSGWPPALAYGAAVVALWAGTRLAINRTRRWWRLGAYVGGIGVCLVPLWFCFENVVRLLPQNI